MCSCRKWQSPPGAWLSAALNHRAAQLLKGKTATARGEEIIRGHVWRRTCTHYLKSSLPGWSHLCGLLQRSIISGKQFLWQTGSVTKMCRSHLCSLCSVKALRSLTRSAERLTDAVRKGEGYHSKIEGVPFQIKGSFYFATTKFISKKTKKDQLNQVWVFHLKIFRTKSFLFSFCCQNFTNQSHLDILWLHADTQQKRDCMSWNTISNHLIFSDNNSAY